MNLDFRYIRWILGHMDEAEVIFSAIQTALAEPELKQKILAFHPVLDAVAEIADDFPIGFGAATEADEPELATQVRNEAAARKINWSRLLEIAERLLPIVLLFLEPKPSDET